MTWNPLRYLRSLISKPRFELSEDYHPYNEDDDGGYGPGSYYEHAMGKDD